VHRWWGGLPEAFEDEAGIARRPGKQLTTICRLTETSDRDRATCWVREALQAGQMLYREADKDFPWKVWYRDPETHLMWMGQCVNSVLGQYKGWPGSEDERVEVFG
jgi:hypothetical protein